MELFLVECFHCVAKFCYCDVMLSVCRLSASFVTRVYCDKTTASRIMRFLLHSS